VPLRDPAGRILKWFGSNTDIEDSVNASTRLEVQLATHAAAGSHHAGHRRAPGSARVFEVVLRSLEDNLGVDFALLCLYQAEPPLLTVACVGERSQAIARKWAREEGAQVEWTRPSVASACGRAGLRAGRDEARFAFAARLARADCARGRRAHVHREQRGLRRAAGGQGEPRLLQHRRREFLRQLSSHVALASQQARLYGALQAAYQDLRQTQQTVMQQERLRALGQIASGIAHDINNALSPPPSTRSRCSRTKQHSASVLASNSP
jgi:signal transduction histidine kinase